MADFESFDGTKISYEQDGDGFPVLLIHGFATDGYINWVRPGVVDALVRAGRLVINVDLRGHGASGKPHDPAAYADDAMVRDVRGLIDHLSLDRLDVVGYSMGAWTTLRLITDEREAQRSAHPDDEREAQRSAHPDDEREAQRSAHPDDEREAQRSAHPDDEREAQRSAHPDDEREAQPSAHADGQARVRRAVLGGIGGGMFTREPERGGGLADAMLTGDKSSITNPIAKSFRDFADLTGADKQALAAIQRSSRFGPPDVGVLSEVSIPVLVLCGDNDPLAGDPQGLADRLANARVAVVGGTHLNVVNNPAFHREVVDFLTEGEG